MVQFFSIISYVFVMLVGVLGYLVLGDFTYGF